MFYSSLRELRRADSRLSRMAGRGPFLLLPLQYVPWELWSARVTNYKYYVFGPLGLSSHRIGPRTKNSFELKRSPEQDHTLPRTWYPDGTSQRLTVPSRRACGAKLKKAEEQMALALMMARGFDQVHEAVVGVYQREGGGEPEPAPAWVAQEPSRARGRDSEHSPGRRSRDALRASQRPPHGIRHPAQASSTRRRRSVGRSRPPLCHGCAPNLRNGGVQHGTRRAEGAGPTGAPPQGNSLVLLGFECGGSARESNSPSPRLRRRHRF
jgi:hypothetical protein